MMCSYNSLDISVNDTEGRTQSTGSIPACAFGALQDGMVRGHWNFSGHIVSDWYSVTSTLVCVHVRPQMLTQMDVSSVVWHACSGAIADFMIDNKCSGCGEVLPTHGFCKDANKSSQCPACSSQCLATAMYRGGTDSSCGGGGDTPSALRAGTLTKSALVASSQHTLRLLFALGLANSVNEQPYKHLGKTDVGSDASRQLNLEAARQSLVLLKNEIVVNLK